MDRNSGRSSGRRSRSRRNRVRIALKAMMLDLFYSLDVRHHHPSRSPVQGLASPLGLYYPHLGGQVGGQVEEKEGQ